MVGREYEWRLLMWFLGGCRARLIRGWRCAVDESLSDFGDELWREVELLLPKIYEAVELLSLFGYPIKSGSRGSHRGQVYVPSGAESLTLSYLLCDDMVGYIVDEVEHMQLPPLDTRFRPLFFQTL